MNGRKSPELDLDWLPPLDLAWDLPDEILASGLDIEPNIFADLIIPEEPTPKDATCPISDEGGGADDGSDYEPPKKKAAKGNSSSGSTKTNTQAQIRSKQRLLDINRRSVKRYQEKKRNKAAQIEADIETTAAELQSLKIENEQLSYTEQALAKMNEYAQDILASVQTTLCSVFPVSTSAPSEENVTDELTSWRQSLPLPLKSLRYAMLNKFTGPVSVPPEAAIRYLIKRATMDGFHKARLNFVEKIQELWLQWKDGDEAKRNEVEKLLEPLFKLQGRTLKALVAERPDLLYSFGIQSPIAYTPEQREEIVISLELTLAQRQCLIDVYREQMQAADHLQAVGNNMKAQCQDILQECHVKDSFKDISEDQAMLLAFLRNANYLTMKTTDAYYIACFTLLKQLTPIQKARILTCYYPGVPDINGLLRAVYATYTRLSLPPASAAPENSVGVAEK